MGKKHEQSFVQQGITAVQNDGLLSTIIKGYQKIQESVYRLGPIDRYCFSHSVRRLKDRQRLESELIGILSVAYGFRGKGLYQTISPQQEGQEVAELAKIVSDREPETVVEIGTAQGGTLYIWSRYFDNNKKICSIDNGPNYSKRTKFFREFTNDTEIVFINSPSQKEETREKIKNETNKSVDFLFIDGDHRYEGVKEDFEIYSSYVNQGGIIAFHDIIETGDTRMGVPKFWKEIKESYEYEEIIKPNEKSQGGIGILYL